MCVNYYTICFNSLLCEYFLSWVHWDKQLVPLILQWVPLNHCRRGWWRNQNTASLKWKCSPWKYAVYVLYIWEKLHLSSSVHAELFSSLQWKTWDFIQKKHSNFGRYSLDLSNPDCWRLIDTTVTVETVLHKGTGKEFHHFTFSILCTQGM